MLSVPPVELAIRERGSAVRRRCLIYRGFHRTAACDFAVDIGICWVKNLCVRETRLRCFM